MAVGTITNQAYSSHGQVRPSIGDMKMSVTNVVGSASYTTGGDTLTPANLSLNTVLHTIVTPTLGSASNAGAVNGSYNIANQTLQCWTSASAEVASTTNLSGLTFTITAFGY
jgi:hypothetical protein